jgi:hypothetical protein
MLATVLYAAFNFVRSKDPRWGYLAAFVGGLALGAHTSSTLITIPVTIYLIWRFRKFPSYRSLFLGLSLIALGFMVYLYLPLRAVQGPAIDWGDPRTLPAAYAHITRRMYGGPSAVRLQFLPFHLLELGKFVWRYFAPAAVAAIVGGLVLGIIRGRPWRFLSVLLLLTGPVSTAFLVLLLQGHQIGEINVWYIPFFMLATLFIGLAVFTLTVHGRRWVRGVGYAGAVVVAALPLALNFSWNYKHNFYFAEDFGANFLRTIAYRGINIMFERGSLGTFETAYLKKVEGYRPDHVFIDGTGSVYREYVLFSVGRLHSGDPIAASRWERQFETDIINTPSNKDVYYSIYRQNVLDYGYTLDPAGMLYRVTRPPLDPRPVRPVWGRYSMRGAEEVQARADSPLYLSQEWVRDALCKYKTMLARDYLLAGDEDKAFATLDEATPLAQGMTESLAEIANIYITHGYPEKAIPYYDQALAAFPRKGVGDDSLRYHYAQIYSNKAVAHLTAGDVDGAEAAFNASLEAYPNQPDIRNLAQREKLERFAAELASPR